MEAMHGSGGLLTPAAGGEECASGLSLSLVEKVLLRRGWTVADICDPRTNLITTRASAGESGPFLSYAKPTYSFAGQDRIEELNRLIRQLSLLDGFPPEIEIQRIRREVSSIPEGYSCVMCGKCCTRMRDAYQGVISEEEVERWRSLGLTRILRLVEREERKGYAIYTAWKNPKTHEYFRRCPWIRKVPGQTRYFCAIHEHKPVKCRSFPLSRQHAEYNGCPGFGEENLTER